MKPRSLRAALVLVALAACTSTPTPQLTASPVVTVPPTPPPTASPTASLTPPASPTATPTPSLAPTPTPPAWAAAKRVARGDFWQPAVVADAAGNVHVVATTGDSQGIWYATNTTGHWVAGQVVASWPQNPGETGIVEQASIAVDPIDESVWIAFSYWSCPDCAATDADGIWVIDNARGTWSEPRQLSHDCQLHPSLVVRAGHVHLACATDGDYVEPPHGAIMFGTDASGEWVMRRVAQRGAYPHLALDADGRVGILFDADDLRYARQNPNGSFAVEQVPGTADGESWHPVLSVDAGRGDQWAAQTRYTSEEHTALFLSRRGQDGWSNPVVGMREGDLIGLGVRDGVVQLLAGKSGLSYASNGNGAFAEQVLEPTSRYWWGKAAFAVLPTGRPIAVILADPPGKGAGIWFLEGPEV